MPVQRKHPVVADYFASIDTPNKAYILGFFMADGCIENPRVVSFVQHADDASVLEFVRHELQCGIITYPLEVANHGSARRLRIASSQMIRDLGRLGFGRRKSETCIFPDIDPALHAPLLLGIFDGDGSIYSHLAKRYINRSWHLHWAGTRPVLEAVRTILSEHCGAKPDASVKIKKGQCHSLNYCGNESVERVGHFLYETSPPDYFIPRKRARFQELYDRPEKAPHPFSLRTVCINGHEYTNATTYLCKKGRRGCRICRTEAMRRFRARRHANL